MKVFGERERLHTDDDSNQFSGQYRYRLSQMRQPEASGFLHATPRQHPQSRSQMQAMRSQDRHAGTRHDDGGVNRFQPLDALAELRWRFASLRAVRRIGS